MLLRDCKLVEFVLNMVDFVLNLTGCVDCRYAMLRSRDQLEKQLTSLSADILIKMAGVPELADTGRFLGNVLKVLRVFESAATQATAAAAAMAAASAISGGAAPAAAAVAAAVSVTAADAAAGAAAAPPPPSPGAAAAVASQQLVQAPAGLAGGDSGANVSVKDLMESCIADTATTWRGAEHHGLLWPGDAEHTDVAGWRYAEGGATAAAFISPYVEELAANICAY